MPKLHLDWSDGRYSTRPLTDEESVKCEALGVDVVHLEDGVYAAYLRDCERDGIWQAFWRAISNEQYMRRRERELLPLEDAAREIERLKDELARAQRMASYFENEWSRAINPPSPEAKPVSETCVYTCIYPQPGCNLDALENAEWRARADEILAKYNEGHAGEGIRHQGCCCDYGAHQLLIDERADALRAAGFLVENDSEDDVMESP